MEREKRASADPVMNSEAEMGFWRCLNWREGAKPFTPALASHWRQAVPGRECNHGLKWVSSAMVVLKGVDS